MKLPVKSEDGRMIDIYGYSNSYYINDSFYVISDKELICIKGSGDPLVKFYPCHNVSRLIYDPIPQTTRIIIEKHDNTYINADEFSSKLEDGEKIDKIVCNGATVVLTSKSRVFISNSWGLFSEENYSDVIDIFPAHIFSGSYIFGLKKEGHIVQLSQAGSSEHIWKDKDRLNDLKSWREIIKIASDHSHVVGLKEDGTVVALGDNGWHQCDVNSWNQIVDISCHHTFTAAKTKTGEFIATEYTDRNHSLFIEDPEYYFHYDRHSRKCIGLEADFSDMSQVQYSGGVVYGITSHNKLAVANIYSGTFSVMEKSPDIIEINSYAGVAYCTTSERMLFKFYTFNDGSFSGKLVDKIDNFKKISCSPYGVFSLDCNDKCYEIKYGTAWLLTDKDVCDIGCGDNYFAYLTKKSRLFIDTKQIKKFKKMEYDSIKKACFERSHIVFLRNNGTVGYAGQNTNRSCSNLEKYSGISDINTTDHSTTLFFEDGSSVTIGKKETKK